MQQLGENLIAYLNNQLSPSEKEKVESWINESSDNRSYFEEVKSLYNATFIPSDDFNPDVDKAWEIVSDQLTDAKVVPMEISVWSRISRLAAAVVFAIGVGYFSYTQLVFESVEIIARTGQVKYIKLSDGTHITLNEKSTLSYHESFGTKNRNVSLKGQAYFNVTPNKDLPFVITGENANVTVVGTSFDFKTNSKKSIVNVVEGVVELASDEFDDPLTLTASMRGIAAKGKLNEYSELDTSLLAWRGEELVFKSSPLADVVKKLSNHFDVEIELEEKISTCLITSSFANQSLDEILQVLDAIANIKSSKSGKVIRLTGPGC